MKDKFYRWLPSRSALEPLEGLPVFQTWYECRPRLGDTKLTKKIVDVGNFFQVRVD